MISNAILHYKIRVSRNDDGIRKAINCLWVDGYEGSMPKTEVGAETDAENFAVTPTVRLELARLEFIRESETKGQSHEYGKLPLGPITHLTFARNIMLENAIEIQRHNRTLSQQLSDSSIKTLTASADSGTPSTVTNISSIETTAPHLAKSSKSAVPQGTISGVKHLVNHSEPRNENDDTTPESLSCTGLFLRSTQPLLFATASAVPLGAKVKIKHGVLSGAVCCVIGYSKFGN